MVTATGLAVTARLSKRAAVPAFRGQRQFSSARPTLKEVQDAYILSASRTPTAKVWTWSRITQFAKPKKDVLIPFFTG